MDEKLKKRMVRIAQTNQLDFEVMVEKLYQLILDDMADQYVESETKHIDELTTECFLPHE